MHLLSRASIVGTITVSAACAALAVFAHAYLSEPRLPYRDHFRNGSMAEWQAYGGNWHVENGVLQNDSDDRGPKVISGSDQLSDYQIDADVQLTKHFGDAGVLLRVTDPEEGANAFYGYYVGVRLPDVLLVGKVDLGFRPLLQVTMREPAAPNAWHHLQVSMRGCDLEVHAFGPSHQPLAEARWHDANCYRHGSFGLRSFESGGMWRTSR